MRPDARFARSAALWLRAYPRRWRQARGAEVAAVLADLAPPGARRLDVGTALGLLVAGWATRARQHPPLGAWLRYRLLRERLPRRYRPWVRDDVEGRWFPLRFLSLLAPAWGLPLYVAFVEPDDGWRVVKVGGLVMFHVVVLAVVWRPARRTGRQLYLERRPRRAEG
ncbi:hypothetical protein AB6N24_06660 [Cellulomonas sp. 179-A 4D5 NHS]|uniref:hypothetical protein n=1 Tax=Cellulomonas sp. 179-A 4D5 NHS TaxID=3142378 RepID=UPI0039A3DB0B